MNDTIAFLEELLLIPSPTGNTERAMAYIEEKFLEIGLQCRYTNKRALIATIEGEETGDEITFAAHVDTLGAMVKGINSNGRVELSTIGGYAMGTIEGEEVIIETFDGREYTGTVLLKNPSVHVSREVDDAKREASNMEVRIDERVCDVDSVKALGIEIGNYVYFKPKVEVTKSGFIKSRHLDNKAGVAIIYAMAKELLNGVKPKRNINFFISNYEEVGHGASASLPADTLEFIAIDMAALGDGQNSDEFSTTICLKDSSGPYNYELSKELMNIAKEKNINYKSDIYPYYGSDASAAMRAGYDFKFALIGPGVDSSHSTERTHRDAIEASVQLGLEFIKSK